jgi:hypothetical protein
MLAPVKIEFGKKFTPIILGAAILRLKIWQDQPELLPKMAFTQLMIFTSDRTGYFAEMEKENCYLSSSLIFVHSGSLSSSL